MAIYVEIDKNVRLQPQITGMGQIISTFPLQINLKQAINQTEVRQFIIYLELTCNNITYYFSNIFSAQNIDSNGNLVLGEITVIGPVDPDNPDVVVQASITYLDALVN